MNISISLFISLILALVFPSIVGLLFGVYTPVFLILMEIEITYMNEFLMEIAGVLLLNWAVIYLLVRLVFFAVQKIR